MKKFTLNDEVYFIKEAELVDTDKILALEESCFSEIFRHSKRYIREAIISKYASVRILFDYRYMPIGYINVVYKRLSNKIHIASICIQESHRGKHLSIKLIKDVILEALNLDYKEINLEVASTNSIALNLYQRLGFECHDTFKNYYIQNIDALRMKMVLDIDYLFPSEESYVNFSSH